MVRSRFPGKPSKFHNRKQVNVSKLTSAQENENAKAAELIYRNLAIFHQTFGPEDPEEEPFAGFRYSDIKASKQTAQLRFEEISRGIKARQIVYLPQEAPKKGLPSGGAGTSKGVKVQKASRTSTNVKKCSVTLNDCNSFNLNCDAGSSHVRRILEDVEEEEEEEDDESTVKKELLISKKQSTRPLAAPNKRFYDHNSDESCAELNCNKLLAASPSKVVLKKARLIVDVSGDAWSRQARDEAQPASDVESETSSVKSSSTSASSSVSASSRASSVSQESSCASDYGQCRPRTPEPKKIVLREARLEVDTQTITKKSGLAHRIVCGVCGAIRFYKFLKQARKFGLWSCESCRKFVSRMIQFASPVTCINGDGSCKITKEESSIVWDNRKKDVVKEIKSRCRACWLLLCMKYYQMPINIKIKLNQSLPQSMRDPELLKKKSAINKSTSLRKSHGSSSETKKPVSRKLGFRIMRRYSTIRGARSQLGRNLRILGRHDRGKITVGSDKAASKSALSRKRSASGPVKKVRFTDNSGSERVNAKQTTTALNQNAPVKEELRNSKRLRDGSTKKSDNKEIDDGHLNQLDEGEEDSDMDLKLSELSKKCASKALQSNSESLLSAVTTKSPRPLIHSPKLRLDSLIIDLTVDEQGENEGENRRPKRHGSLSDKSSQDEQGKSDKLEQEKGDRLSQAAQPNGESTRQKRKAALNSRANIARVAGRVTESKTPADNKLEVAKNLKKRATALARKEVAPTKPKQDVKKVKRKKNLEASVVGDRVADRGPRVKHVCRSAKLALGSPVATFSSNQPVSVKSGAKEMNVEDDDDTPIFIPMQSDNNTSIKNNAPEVTKSEEVISISSSSISHRLRQPSTEISSRERDESAQLSRMKSSQLPPKYIARTLQDLGKQNCELLDGIVEERQDCTVTMDFWESYDPEEVSKTGFALMGSDPSFRVPSLCFLCGSAGKDRLIHCACCCEPYHRYCVEGGTRDWGGDGDDPAWWRIDWLCPRCTVCAACGQAGSRAHLACNKCRRTYHADCLPNDRLARLHSTDRAWVCHSCLRCRSCNDKSVSMFVGNLPLCNPCFKLRQKGNFCPLCQRCYDDDDFDTKMMECGKCKCWVHAKCEGLSNEKYEVLSFLPESVEFICKLCAETTPASWRTAIETELRTGFMNVLKSLSKNRKAGELLKSSPKNCLSICSCVNSTVRAGTKFAEIGATDSTVSPISKSESADPQRTSEQSVSCDMSESSINTECLPNPDPTEPSLGKVKSHEEESKTEGTMVLPQEQCLPRVELQIRSSDFDQQLFLPNGNRLSDSKAAQYSPHATSQSDSGIGSTDDELKPSPVINDAVLSLRKQCFCYEPESRRKSTQPTLIHVKKKVYNNDYTSLFEFHQDLQKVIWSADDIDLSKYYNQTLQDIFPWFDPKYSQVCQRKDTSMIVTPKKEEADKEDSDEEQDVRESYKKTSKILGGLLDLDKDYYYRGLKFADVRVCVLCKQEGDGELIAEGRLLYCGHNEWIHANCALWSNEVFEEIDGSLQNVHSAISRSRLIRCVDCDKRGASVGCCYKNCPESYHFPCARKGRCAFMEDKTIYCNLHRGASRSRPLLAKDFPVYRPVYVELDRRKKKFVPHNQVRIMIGSLSVDHIGEFVEELSDHESTIVPCQFVCTRLFWSSLEPWRLVQYTVRTRILKTKAADHSVETEANFTFDHSLEHNNTLPQKPNESDEKIHSEVKQLLDSMLDAVCVKEEESCLSDAQNAADLLPPELKDAIFEDLPFDLLDGISMQDIFPKMMSYDDPMDVKIEKECRPDVKTADSVSNKPPKSSNLPRLEQTNKRLPLTLKHKMHGTSTGKTPRFSSKEPIKPKAIVKPDINNQVGNRFHSSVGPNTTPTKIVQLDGTVDYSSESEFPANESDDSTFTPTLHVTIQDTVAENVEERSRGYDQLMKCRLLQVDGANDLTSDSESGSLKQEEESDYSDIDQLDGAVDVDVSTDDKPVKCSRCHRTYRTALSYQRHFPTCSSDFISSCSESDSSEEDKVPSPAAAVSTLPPIQEEVTLVEPTSDFCQGAEDVVEYVVQTHESPNGVQQSMCINSALYDQSENIINTTQNEIYSYVEETEVVQEVPFTSTPSVPQNCIILSNDNDGIKLKPCGENTYYIDDKQFNSAAVLNSLNQLLNAKNEQAKKPKVSFVSTPVNHAINVGPSQSSSAHQVIDYQNQSSPTIILQSVPSQNRVQSYPSYSYPQQTSQQGIQYIAAIEQPEKQSYPLLSQPYQLQSSPVQTAVIPTVLGTIIQPNGGMEQVILNTNTNSIDGSGGQLVFGQQSTGNNLYISNQPQMYVNMETVVSNTVMSSSQFVSVPGSVPGMLSTYSATTTQVYQAAKPVIDLPQSYVIVNTSPTSAQVVQNGNSRSPNNIPTQPPRPTVSLQIQQPVNSSQFRQQAPQQVQVQHLQKSQQQNSHQPQHPPQNNHQQQQNRHQQYHHQQQNRQQQNHHVPQNHHQHQTQNHKQNHYPSNQTTPKQVQKPSYSSIRQKIIAEWSDKDDVIVKPAVKPIEKPAIIRKNHDEKKKELIKMVNATEQTIVIESVAPCKFKYKPFNVKTVPLQKVCKQFVNAIPIGKVSALPKSNPPQMKVFPHKIIPVQKCEELKPEKQQPVKQYESCEEAFDRLKNSVNKASYQYKSDANSSCKDVQTNGHLDKKLLTEELVKASTTNKTNSVDARKLLTEALVKASTTNKTNSVDASLAGRTLINNKQKPLCYQPTILNGNQVHQKPSFDAKAKRKELEEAMLFDKALNDAECIIVVQSNTDDNVVQINESNKKPVVENVLPKSISVNKGNTGAKVDIGGKKVNGSKPSKSVKLKTQGCSKKEALKKISDTVKSAKKSTSPKIIFEINSQDGFSYSSSCLEEAWEKVFEAVQTARLSRNLPPLPKNPFRSVNTNMKMLGLDNNSLKYILEQIPGVRKCVNYRPKYHKKDRRVESEQREEKENESGCARSEPFAGRNKYDMFSWLASRHRRPPKLLTSETDIVNGNRRATSLNLPMAMRFRHLKETSKEAVGVFRSDIHGRGLFCLRDIDSGEMVIEYAGEVIRSALTDKRERFYTSKGIGCYMFRIDDHFVVDATMKGNAARFINHSCEPNCYSRVVDILGKKHILIFALRRIPQGEELTYDYKFPLEDDKIRCHCLSRKCRKYLN